MCIHLLVCDCILHKFVEYYCVLDMRLLCSGFDCFLMLDVKSGQHYLHISSITVQFSVVTLSVMPVTGVMSTSKMLQYLYNIWA